MSKRDIHFQGQALRDKLLDMFEQLEAICKKRGDYENANYYMALRKRGELVCKN
jgi:hypothetical protein